MPRKRATHIVINFMAGTLECRHCGEIFNFNSILPAPIEAVSGFVKGWGAPHKHCKLTDKGKRLQALRDKQWRAHQEKEAKK
jgi:hypothetical protein